MMQDCGSAKHGTIRMASFDLNIITKERLFPLPWKKSPCRSFAEINQHFRTFSNFTMHLNFGFMLGNDMFYDGKAKAGAAG